MSGNHPAEPPVPGISSPRPLLIPAAFPPPPLPPPAAPLEPRNRQTTILPIPLKPTNRQTTSFPPLPGADKPLLFPLPLELTNRQTTIFPPPPEADKPTNRYFSSSPWSQQTDKPLLSPPLCFERGPLRGPSNFLNKRTVLRVWGSLLLNGLSSPGAVNGPSGVKFCPYTLDLIWKKRNS
jgi:hypothetical protein